MKRQGQIAHARFLTTALCGVLLAGTVAEPTAAAQTPAQEDPDDEEPSDDEAPSDEDPGDDVEVAPEEDTIAAGQAASDEPAQGEQAGKASAAEAAPEPAATPAASPPKPPAPVSAPPAPEPGEEAIPIVLPQQETAPAASSPLRWNLFVDTSYSYTTARTGTPVPAHRAWETNSFDGTNGRLTNNGFNLHWLGVDASYDVGDFAATGSLRFGTAVPIYFGSNRSDLGTDNLTQAYVSWRPTSALNLDLGQFNTIYGAEVAESWKNLNYSRGALYYAMQPSHHTGLRANYAISDAVGVTALVVNGVNSVVDDNDKPSLGLQIGLRPSDAFNLYAGYLGALEPSTDADPFSHFFDLVASVSTGDLQLTLNADYNIHRQAIAVAPGGGTDDATFFGISVAAGYSFSELLGVALRYEHLGDPDNTVFAATGASDVNLDTLTGTLDIRPVRGMANLIIRWDNRYELSSERIFFNKDSGPTGKWFASILGVVVTTEN